MEKHVIAVIGCGRIAQNAHFKALSQILRFFAGAEIDFDRAESIEVAKFVQGGLLAVQAENEWIDLSVL